MQRKRILSLVLVLLLTFSLIPVGTSFSYAEPGANSFSIQTFGTVSIKGATIDGDVVTNQAGAYQVSLSSDTPLDSDIVLKIQAEDPFLAIDEEMSAPIFLYDPTDIMTIMEEPYFRYLYECDMGYGPSPMVVTHLADVPTLIFNILVDAMDEHTVDELEPKNAVFQESQSLYNSTEGTFDISVKLENGKKSQTFYLYCTDCMNGEWVPYPFTVDLSVKQPSELISITTDKGQFDNENWLYDVSKGNKTFLVVPNGCDSVSATLTFSGSAEVSVNGAAAEPTDAENKYTATLSTLRSTTYNDAVIGADINTLSIVANGSIQKTYTIYAVQQRFSALPDEVIDYLCVASQYTNFLGDELNAYGIMSGDYGLRGVRSLVGSNYDAGGGFSGPVSLGGFGGYIVYRFDEAIKDDPNNPYGIDFITFGNAYSPDNEFAEPGQVWVSEDGKTWYAIAGSVHYDDNVFWDYEITYKKTSDNTVTWTDNRWYKENPVESRFPYPDITLYPLHDFGSDSDTITLKSIHLGSKDLTEPLFPGFGYTDVGRRFTLLDGESQSEWGDDASEMRGRNIAGNPYLGWTELSGGKKSLSVTDGIDLAWAVDSEGQPVTFENGIHYVKIVTASNIDAGAIGEKSTEVNMVRVAQASDSSVGVSTAPANIKFDGNVVELSSGTQISDNVFSFTGDAALKVRGAFDVEVEAPEGSHVYINNNPKALVSYDKIPDHGIIRVIVQNGEKEPLIYVFSLAEDEVSQEEIDQEAALAVDRLIEAIGEVTLQSKTAIEEARAAYDALTDAQKALVTKLDVLEAAEAAYAALAAQDFGTVRVIVENTTYSEADGAPWEGTLVDTTVELTADSSMIGVVAQAVEAAGYTQTGASNGYISEINGLKQFDGGTDSGWMGMLNDWVTNQGFDAFTVANGKLEGGDEIHIFYTVTGLGTEGSETSLADLKASVGELSPEFDPETLNYTLTVPAGTEEVKLTPSATDKNFYVSIKSGGTEYKRTKSIPVTDGTVITLEVGAPTMNTGFTPTTYKVVIAVETSDAVKRVEDLIDAIGEVTADSGDAIFAARTAYDALTDEEKAQVSNYADLQAAEEAFAALNEAAANAVEDLIDAIPDTVTEDDKEAIEAARAAYDALTDEQKAKVENYEDLLAAEAALDKLEQAAVEDIFKTTGDYIENLIKEKGLTVNPIGGEWAVIGLARAGREVPDLDKYLEKVDEFIAENINDSEQLHRALSTENSRLILALTALGKDVSDANGHDLVAGLSDLSFVKKQGINGPIWALIALDAHAYEPAEGATATRDALIEEILAAQLEDGGWVLSSTATSADGDMTGMALQALAPYYKTNDKVKAAVDKALDCLSDMQNAVGGFGSTEGGGATLESCAQVVTALAALGIDPATDERFVKNGLSVLDALCSYYVEGGGFEHIAGGGLDGMATEQGYYALAAYFRFKDGQTSLYDMSDVEIEKSEEPAEPTEDEKAAAAVDEKIAAIGDVTLESEEDIKAAREAYEALTDEQKKLVTKLDVLEAAEKRLEELKKAAADGTITKAVDKNGKDIAFTLDDVDEKHILTKEKAAEVNNKIDSPDQVEILWQKDIVVPDGTAFPATLTFAVPKDYQDKDVFVYHYNGTDWEVVAEGKGSEVSAKFDSLSPGALVAKTEETPSTGDSSNMFLWAGVCVVAVAAAAVTVISGKKRRED